MKTKRILAVLMAAALFVLPMAGCNGGESGNSGDASTVKKDRIRLGILAPLSGNLSSYGQTAYNGFNLAVDEYNKDKDFESVIPYVDYDEKGNVQEAANAYRKLVDQDKITALIGDITSDPSIEVASLAAQDKLPMITPTGTAAEITNGKDNVFRACFLDETQGRTMAKVAADTLKFKKVAVIYNSKSEYSLGLKDAFVDEAGKHGIEIVASESYSDGDMDYKSQLTTIASKKPEAIYMPDYYQTVYAICTQKKTIAAIADVPTLGGDGWDGVLGIDGAKAENVENAYFTNHFSPADDAEIVQNFVKAYKEKYNSEPSSFAALGYDATMMMFAAIDNAGGQKATKEGIVEALKGLKYEGVTGSITFDDNGDPIKPITIIQIKGGKYTLHSKA